MAKIVQYNCDRCGRLRTPTNHWFLAFTEINARIQVIPFFESKTLNDHDRYSMLCGEECMLKYVSEHLKDMHYKALKETGKCYCGHGRIAHETLLYKCAVDNCDCMRYQDSSVPKEPSSSDLAKITVSVIEDCANPHCKHRSVDHDFEGICQIDSCNCRCFV